jgi:hypothetical protein
MILSHWNCHSEPQAKNPRIFAATNHKPTHQEAGER